MWEKNGLAELGQNSLTFSYMWNLGDLILGRGLCFFAWFPGSDLDHAHKLTVAHPHYCPPEHYRIPAMFQAKQVSITPGINLTAALYWGCKVL